MKIEKLLVNGRKTVNYLKKNGLMPAYYAAKERLEQQKEDTYQYVAPAEAELEQQKNGTLTEEEHTYMEEVKFCYEDDGMIDEKERKYLDRIREKFGITPERAQELEQLFLQSRLTDNEQEYVNAMKEEMVDGVIPDSARRLLNRLRTSMDITEERAKELEQYIQ